MVGQILLTHRYKIFKNKKLNYLNSYRYYFTPRYYSRASRPWLICGIRMIFAKYKFTIHKSVFSHFDVFCRSNSSYIKSFYNI